MWLLNKTILIVNPNIIIGSQVKKKCVIFKHQKKIILLT